MKSEKDFFGVDNLKKHHAIILQCDNLEKLQYTLYAFIKQNLLTSTSDIE